MISNNGPERLIAQMKSMTESLNGFKIISTLTSKEGSLLCQFMPFKTFINERSITHGLKRNGEFYFNFSRSGFTGIVCFERSHLSIQTDPLVQRIDFDVFFSDRILNNINISENLYRDTIAFFHSTIMNEEYINL